MGRMSAGGMVTRLSLVALLTGVVGLGSAAATTTPSQHVVPSFNESPGCGARTGLRGPIVSTTGALSDDEPIYGPWGDFFGRTVGSVREQLVSVRLPSPGGGKVVAVHERVLPALLRVVDNLNAEAAQGNTYTITSSTSSYSARTIPPGRRMSFHAVGAAIDLNHPANPYRSDNLLITDMVDEEAENPYWFVDAWRRAGWCWGGDWVTIKDTMHFSWKGPAHTPGYTMPPPQPPMVAPAAFTATTVLPVRLPAPDPTARHGLADVTGNGAIDVVRVERGDPESGRYRVVIATASSWYRSALTVGTTRVAPSDPEAPFVFADINRSGAADLVYLLVNEESVSLEVFMSTGGVMPKQTIATRVPPSPGATYLFADHDRDGRQDLFVVRPGAPATLEIWPGPHFRSPAHTYEIDVALFGTLLALGDRNVDGIPDLFALTPQGRLVVHLGASAYAESETAYIRTPPNQETLTVADLDGDGYGDLLLLRPDGATRMLRGGASTHLPGAWFASVDLDELYGGGGPRMAVF